MIAAQIPQEKVPVGHVHGFRDGTEATKVVFNYMFNDEGMGGYINYAGVTTWLARNMPFLHGRVWVENFLVPLMRDIHAPYKNWKVQPSNEFHRLVEHGTPAIGSMLSIGGRPAKREYLNALGTHPFDVGFGHYASTCPAPRDAYLPVLDYPRSMILNTKTRRDLQAPYVVFTAGGTTPIRTMKGKHLRPLVEHVNKLGFKAVFLGKKDILADGKATTAWLDDMDYSSGLDLRDQTSVREAACIMQHAKCTVGVDGGLLHLAALMHESRIVFGYNITTVEHREPRRIQGRHVNVALTREELSCSGCQSNWKGMWGHTYDKCYYQAEDLAAFGEPKCMHLLFANDSIKFKNAIDEVLRD